MFGKKKGKACTPRGNPESASFERCVELFKNNLFLATAQRQRQNQPVATATEAAAEASRGREQYLCAHTHTHTHTGREEENSYVRASVRLSGMQNMKCRCFRLVFQLLNISMQITQSHGDG